MSKPYNGDSHVSTMESYVAKGIFRNGHTNSILASSPARKLVALRASRQFREHTENKIIAAGNGIRLAALYNTQPHKDAPCVVLLHGWLGCANSLYLLTLGNALFQQGYNVIRLNFRDHGDSQHLNEKLFHSCRIQEVINACKNIQKEFSTPLSLIGFSLGANFALRVNAYTTAEELHLQHTLAFCPVIDPANTLHALEHSSLIYRNHFMQRWKTSLHSKAESFPTIYDKKTFEQCKTLRQATELLATRYAGFASLNDYLSGYSIAGDRLTTLRVPAQIVLAKDDPIIPWQDADKLIPGPFNNILITDHGGHCGFLAPDLSTQWIEQFSLAVLMQ